MLWLDLDAHAKRLVESAERYLVLVAPFAKKAIVEAILDRASDGIEIQLYTRWRVEDVASKVTDTGVLEIVENRKGTVWLVDDLHAKLFIADGTSALVGSANLTAAGLGVSRHPNLEIMTIVEDGSAIAPFLLALRSRARLATRIEADEVDAAADALRLKLPPFVWMDAKPPSEPVQHATWMPGFRSPDRLFRLYSDEHWWLSVKRGEAALVDLAFLALPSGMKQKEFDERVRSTLLSSPWVKELDGLLREPQRFGAIAAMIGAYMPGAHRDTIQSATQVAIRWLLHFAPDRFGMRTPNYSEILFKR